MTANVVVQMRGIAYTEKELYSTAAKIWTDDIQGEEIRKIELYVKPSDRRCYCVVNGEPFHFGI